MSVPTLHQIDRRVLESVPGMGWGYLLYLSNHTWSESFREFGVEIGDEDLCARMGTSRESTA